MFPCLQDICRPVFCRVGSIPVSGRCERSGSVKDVTVFIYFIITHVNGQSVKSDWLENQGGKLQQAIEDELKTWHIPRCLYDLCEVQLRKSDGENNFFFVGYRPFLNCSYEDLFKYVKSMSRKKITLFYNITNDNVHNQVETGFEMTLSLPQLRPTLMPMQSLSSQQCLVPGLGLSIDSELLETCPRIRLSADDQDISNATMTRLKEKSFDKSRYEGTAAHDRLTVCLKDYFSTMEEYSSSQSLHPEFKVAAILIIVSMKVRLL